MTRKQDWIVYPDINVTVDDYLKHLNMTEEKNTQELEIISTKNDAGESDEILTTDEVVELLDEEKELTEEEKREELIKQLKESKIRFNPIKHIGNVTINQFGNDYKKKRQKKNKAQKKSRRLNR